MGKKTTKIEAVAATSNALVPHDPNTALEPWEAELEAEALKSKEAVAGIGGGNAVSIRGGKLKVAGAEVPSGEIAVVILAHTNMKTYYSDPNFDLEQPQSPACFAFGKSVADLAPHKDSEASQCDSCGACRWNEFGTSETGSKKGKRCKDAIRMAFIEGGTLDGGKFAKPEAGKLQSSEVYTLNIPATSLKACAAYVRNVAEVARRPLYGVFTKIKVEPDEKTQVKVSFECLGMIDKDAIAAVRARTSTGEEIIVMPFPKSSDKEAAPAAKPAAKGKKARNKF
jgi:hypothetical protein